MDESKNLRTKMIASLIGLIATFLVLVFSVTTFCWFAETNDTHAAGTVVRSDSADLSDLSLTFYPVTDITGSVYTFDPAVTATELPCFDAAEILISGSDALVEAIPAAAAESVSDSGTGNFPARQDTAE